MRRTTLLVAVLVVVGMVAAPAVGAVAQDGDDEQDEPDVAPGERLSGVVGVQQAEFDGEVERNAFTIALENADDNATKASHVAEQLNESERRLADLQDRKAELDEQRESGEMTEGRYRAEIAGLAVEGENVRDRLNQSEAAANGLPEETLEENGVNVSAIRTLQQNADELTGGEVAEIARSIAGDERGEVDRQDRDAADDRDDRRTDDERSDGSDRQDDDGTEDGDRSDGTETAEDRGSPDGADN